MANRVVPPKRILNNFHYNTTTKPLNSPHPSVVVPPSILEKQLSPATTTPHSIDLKSSEKLFSSVSNSTLLHSSAVLHATAMGPMVDLGVWTMKSKLFQTGVLKDAMMAVTRKTFYKHFCAGEDAVAACRRIRSINEAGLRGILGYGVEEAHDNDCCDRNLNNFLHTVDVSISLPPSSVIYASLIFFFSSIEFMKILLNG